MYFPFELNLPASWSDVAVIYTDISHTNYGSRTPVIYAALGTSSGYVNNAVYWTEPTQWTLNNTNTMAWWVGDPGGSPFSNPAVLPPTGVDSRTGGFDRGQFAIPGTQSAIAANG